MPIDVAVNVEQVEGAAAHERLLERAVLAAGEAGAAAEGEFSLTLLDDVAISEMNRRFLAHQGPTDVISFALYEAGEMPVGDIYIGWEQALRQAAENGVPTEQELARLAVHGTLHVLGADHPEGEERLESDMWRLQERVLAGLFP